MLFSHEINSVNFVFLMYQKIISTHEHIIIAKKATRKNDFTPREML
jgi:hypothetical protein